MSERISLQCCQFGVPYAGNAEGVMDCGEPAIAVWKWGDGSLYVCEKHDRIVEEGEVQDE